MRAFLSKQYSLFLKCNLYGMPADCGLFFSSGALHRRMTDFNAAIDDYLLAMDKTDHEESNSTYKEAQRQLLLCYNDFAVECFRLEQLRTMPSK